ncbi:MAG: hypothetical protein ABI867_39315, partial [Kofleriaceae bacterium]
MRVLVIVAIASCGSRDAEPPSERRPAPGYVPVTQPAPPKPPAFEVAPPTDAIVALGRGERHACVVRASGAVDCWGQHEPCTDHCELPPPPDARVRRVPGVDDAIAISENARCVIRKPGTVACLAPDRLELVAVAELAQVRAIDPAARCFVVGTGGVRCLDAERHVVTVANVRDAVAVVSADSLAC